MKKAQTSQTKNNINEVVHHVDMLNLFESEDSDWYGATSSVDHYSMDEAAEILREIHDGF